MTAIAGTDAAIIGIDRRGNVALIGVDDEETRRDALKDGLEIRSATVEQANAAWLARWAKQGGDKP